MNKTVYVVSVEQYRPKGWKEIFLRLDKNRFVAKSWRRTIKNATWFSKAAEARQVADDLRASLEHNQAIGRVSPDALTAFDKDEHGRFVHKTFYVKKLEVDLDPTAVEEFPTVLE